jgi:hypothetical protein
MKTAFFHGLAAALAIATVAGVPAGAQNRNHRQSTARAPTSAEDIRVLHRFAHCIARRNSVATQRLLAMDFHTTDYDMALRRLADRNSECLGEGRLRFSPMLFAGGMAESLLRWRLEGGDLAARTALDPNRPPIVARDETEVMSLCTVRAAPAEVAALLRTEPAGVQEAAAIRALTPQIRQCLAAGVRANLNRPAVRALLALAAYRLSEAAE